MVDSAPIIAVKSLKVSDFQGMLLTFTINFYLDINEVLFVLTAYCYICLSGVSVSTVGKSTLVINPELPEAEKLKAW